MCTDTDSLFYIGNKLNNLGTIDYQDTFTNKINLVNNQLNSVELINDYGIKYLFYPEYENIISIGEKSLTTVGVWPYTTTEYNLGLLSNDLYSTIQAILSVQGSVEWSDPTAHYYNYPLNFQLLTLNDENYFDYGLILYYKTLDTDNGSILHFTCYNSDFSEILWYNNNSNISSDYIKSSTCVPINGLNHYIMYFSNNQLEIRDRLDGTIVYSQDSNFTPFEIIENSYNELLFFVEQENDQGYKVYKLAEDIFLNSNENTIPNSNYMLENYPNPFNPSTTIELSIREESKVELSIYNMKGQKINTLLNNQITSGKHSIVWNGEDNSGKKVGSGVYFYQLNVNGETKSAKKCLLLK